MEESEVWRKYLVLAGSFGLFRRRNNDNNKYKVERMATPSVATNANHPSSSASGTGLNSNSGPVALLNAEICFWNSLLVLGFDTELNAKKHGIPFSSDMFRKVDFKLHVFVYSLALVLPCLCYIIAYSD